jgi:hypothetical protein
VNVSLRLRCGDGVRALHRLINFPCRLHSHPSPPLQLWDWVPNEEAAAVSVSTTDTWEASTRLARLARSRWLTRTGGADDTTVVVIRLG